MKELQKRPVGRPPGKPSKARQRAILVKVTDGERQVIRELAGETPVATYLREKGMGR